MSLHTLMKELPGDIKTSEDFDEKDKVKEKNGFLTFDEWISGNNNLRPRIGDDSCYSDEENGQYYWNRKNSEIFAVMYCRKYRDS
jgi:hypothetical protein